MTAYERIKGMVTGSPVDRPGIAAWYHMPLVDRNARDFADCVVNSVNFMKWDICKVQSHPFFIDEAFGQEYTPSLQSNLIVGPITKYAVYHPHMFRELKVPSLSAPSIAREFDALKRILDELGGKVPVISTLYSAAYTARDLCSGVKNPELFLSFLKYSPEDVQKGLETINAFNFMLADELVKIGVDGVFLADAFASTDAMDEHTHDEFVKKYDVPLLERLKGKTWFNILHVHGYKDLRFSEYEKAGYAVQAYSWEDCMTGPGTTSLQQARAFTDKVLIGGIEFWHDFDSQSNDREEVKAVIKKRLCNAIAQLGEDDKRFIFAPGCSVKMHVPKYRLKLIHEVMEEITGVN